MNLTNPRIDLNLLRVLDTVYRLGSTTAAAEHLCVSQPAISHALARLRRVFGDPLFVMRGKQLRPTSAARSLAEAVGTHLQGLAQAMAHAQTFEPQRLEITLRVGFRDLLETLALPPLVALLERQAPGMNVVSLRFHRDELEEALADERVDVAVDSRLRDSSRVNSEPLWNEQLVVLMRRAHPLAKARMSLAAYASARHVAVSLRPVGQHRIDETLREQGLNRRIVVQCQHYYPAARLVAESDLLLTAPRAYADHVADQLDLLGRSLPFDPGAIPLRLYWAAHLDRDPTIQWLRQQVRAAVLSGSPSPASRNLRKLRAPSKSPSTRKSRS